MVGSDTLGDGETTGEAGDGDTSEGDAASSDGEGDGSVGAGIFGSCALSTMSSKMASRSPYAWTPCENR